MNIRLEREKLIMPKKIAFHADFEENMCAKLQRTFAKAATTSKGHALKLNPPNVTLF